MACNGLIRLMRKSYLRRVPILPRFISVMIRFLYSCEIQPTADISPRAALIHRGLGCVFHENVVIEDGVKIYQNVTLGGAENRTPDWRRVAIILLLKRMQ